MIRITKIWSRILPISRDWIAISNAAVSSGHGNGFTHIPVVKQENNNINVDILPQSLNSCNDFDHILQNVQMNHKTMDSKKSIENLESILLKGNEAQVGNLKDLPEVAFLLKNIQTQLRTMTVGNAVYALKTVLAFDIPSTDYIVQALFQLVRRSINDLTLNQIIRLDHAISGISSPTPLTQAIKSALPIVFKTQLKIQLNRNSIEELKRIFGYVSKRQPDEESITFIVQALSECKSEITPKQAQSLLRSFTKIPFIPPMSELIVPKLHTIMAENTSIMYNRTIENMFERIVRLVVGHRKMIFYHETFIDNCINKYLWEQPAFSSVCKLLTHLNVLRHGNTRILDYMASQVVDKPSLFMEYHHNLSHFLLGMLISDYKPIVWDQILNNLMESEISSNPMFKDELAKLALNFIGLDHYYPKLISRVFTNASTSLSHVELRRVLLLYQCIKSMFPDYDGPWPSEVLLQYIKPVNFISRISFTPLLVKALGGHEYVKTNMKTKLGHRIDYVIVIRKGGFPVAINLPNNDHQMINMEEELTESLEIPPESKAFFILNLPYFAYTSNSKQLMPEWKLYIKSIEKWTGHNVVAINKLEFDNLPDQEKIPYFMKHLKQQYPNLYDVLDL